MVPRPTPFGCTQTLPNVSALRMPVHFATGCGARHLSSPVGGAANGTPLNTRTPGVDADTPAIRPASVLIGSGTAARKTLTDASTAGTATLFFIPKVGIAYRRKAGGWKCRP